MTMVVDSYSVTASGVLSIAASLTAQAGYCIESLYAVCNGVTVGRVPQRRDWTNYYTVGSTALATLTTASGTLLIPLWMLPNGQLTVTVHALYRNNSYGITDTTHLIEDTPVDLSVENTFYVAPLTASPTVWPEGVIAEPVTLTFDVPASSETAEVSVTLAAVDNVAVTGYLITETSTAPLASDPRWSSIAPTSYTVSSGGNKTLYAWARDADGNISDPVTASVVVTVTEVAVAATGTERAAQIGTAAASGSGTVATTGTEQTATAGTAASTGSANVAALGIDTSLEIGQATATGGGLAPGFYLRSAAGMYYALADSQGRQYALSN